MRPSKKDYRSEVMTQSHQTHTCLTLTPGNDYTNTWLTRRKLVQPTQDEMNVLYLSDHKKCSPMCVWVYVFYVYTYRSISIFIHVRGYHKTLETMDRVIGFVSVQTFIFIRFCHYPWLLLRPSISYAMYHVQRGIYSVWNTCSGHEFFYILFLYKMFFIARGLAVYWIIGRS